MRGLPRILSLYATSLINSIIRDMNIRFYLSHDIKKLANCNFGVKSQEISLFYAML